MPLRLTGGVRERHRKLFVAVRRCPQWQDQEPPCGLAAFAGGDDAVPILHGFGDRVLPPQRDAGPFEVDFGEGDLSRRWVLEVVAEVQDGEGDRIPCSPPA
jgi:hypothetical protein